jgi:Na+/melibiose symporter-like transporter
MARAPLPRQFQLLWGATALSNIGDGLRLVALPLLATSITRDPRLIAGVAIAEQVPWLVFTLPGGAWADRLDRRWLRMRLDAARAVVMLGLVGFIAADRVSIAIIYIVAALLASAEAVVDSSSMALVPAMVDDSELERAAGLLSSTELATNNLVGPPLGALLFGIAMVVPFTIDAASFAGAALIMALVSGTFVPSTSGKAERSSMTHEIIEGFRWFWQRRLLRNLALISTALGTVSFIGAAIFVLFARETLGLSNFGYGLLLLPEAAGGIAGSALASRLTRFPLRVVLSVSVVTAGLATWITSTLSVAVLVGVLTGLTAAGVLVWNVLTTALRQRVIPDHLLGRVGASYRFLVTVGMPFGALLGGLLANSFGLRAALAVNGIALTAIGLAIPILLRDQVLDFTGGEQGTKCPDAPDSS